MPPRLRQYSPTVAATLSLLLYSQTPYSRGYRCGAGAVAPDDPAPPLPGDADREEWMEGRADALAHVLSDDLDAAFGVTNDR